MKVLLVAMNYAPERSGTAPYTAAWAEHMARTHTVAVLAGPPHYPEWRIHDGYGAWTDTRTENGVRVRRLRHHVPATTSAPARLLHETTFAARVLTQRVGRPDVVLAVSPPSFGAQAAAVHAHRLRVPFGVVVQDIYSVGVRELGAGSSVTTAAAAGMERLESRLLQSGDAVLTIHDRFAASLAGLGVDPRRISVVGNWVHIPPPAVPRAEQRRRMGWGDDEHVVLHAGNMGAKQGLTTVVEAARRAQAENLPVRYVLMGDGNQRPALAREADGLTKIEFLPSATSDEYANILGAADLLLICEQPGVAEMSLPSKLTSYCAAGRPVLAAVGAAGATATALAASGAGVVSPAGDPAALNRAALDLLTDPARSAELGRRGVAFAAANQGAAAAMAGYDRWLEALMSAEVGRRA